MKKIVISLLAILVIALICFTVFHRPADETKLDANLTEKTEAVESKIIEEKEIRIYDIEEGYMMVTANNAVAKHNYDWEKLINENGMYQYKDKEYHSKLGIDVSSHQNTIDWEKVKNAGIEFAFLRLGYRGYGSAGNIVIDSRFEENYRDASKQGIKIGVYFFSQAITIDEVREEAEFVLNKLKNKVIDYPVVFDLEKIKNDTARTDNLTMEEITDMTVEFCNIIEKNGYKPSVYGNAKTFTTKMHLEKLNSVEKWYADYQEKPLYPYEFSIWQYTETGRINGIKGNVDIDIQFIKNDKDN